MAIFIGVEIHFVPFPKRQSGLRSVLILSQETYPLYRIDISWLLPIYYTDNKKSKNTECLRTLNQKLNPTHGFTIDEVITELKRMKGE